MNSEKFLKFTDYAAGFFLFMVVAMSFSRWIQEDNFYPLWLIILSLLLFFILFFVRQKKISDIDSTSAASPNLSPEQEKAERKAWEKQWKENLEIEKEAHDLVEKICRSKGIKLTLEQEGRGGGHMIDTPEVWLIEKPIPLTPDELYAISSNGVLYADTKLHDDQIIYAHGFSRGGSWVRYELKKNISEYLTDS